jgi:hypothetical protein
MENLGNITKYIQFSNDVRCFQLQFPHPILLSFNSHTRSSYPSIPHPILLSFNSHTRSSYPSIPTPDPPILQFPHPILLSFTLFLFPIFLGEALGLTNMLSQRSKQKATAPSTFCSPFILILPRLSPKPFLPFSKEGPLHCSL